MNEKRLFQQCLFVAGSLEKVQLQLMFRIEERWFDVRTKEETDTGTYSWRFRHRIDFKKSLGEKWRVMAGDEYMLQSMNKKNSFNYLLIFEIISVTYALHSLTVLKTVDGDWVFPVPHPSEPSARQLVKAPSEPTHLIYFPVD